MKGCSIPITVIHGWDQPSFLLKGWKETVCHPYTGFMPLEILVGWSWWVSRFFMGQEWQERAAADWKSSLTIPLSSLFVNVDHQHLLLLFKNGYFKLIMMLTRSSLNELFHFITSIPKSLLEIRMTIKHSVYQSFIMDSVNSPPSAFREKEQFVPA